MSFTISIVLKDISSPLMQVKRKVKIAHKRDDEIRTKEKEVEEPKPKEHSVDDREELDFQFDEELDNIALGTHRTNKFTEW